MLNIADNGITNAGLSSMLEGLDVSSCPLVYLNVSNNDLSYGCIQHLVELINRGNLHDLRMA